MAKHSMSYPGHEGRKTTPIHDQLQIALAVADEAKLKSLVANCYPPILPWNCITRISSRVGVPVQYKQAADGVISFEGTVCEQKELSDSEVANMAGQYIKDFQRNRDDYCLLRGFFTKTRVIYEPCEPSLEGVCGYLKELECSSIAISNTLQMSVEWLDSNSTEPVYEINCSVKTDAGKESVKRLIKICDGPDSFVILCQDFVSPQCPVIFRNTHSRILVEIKTEIQSFGEVVEQINRYREKLGIQKAILICDTVSDLEAKGFISQEISIYPAKDFVLLAPAR